MKIYVGCALTHAPESFKQDIEDIKAALRAEHEILDFIGAGPGEPRDVYLWDIGQCVAHCDMMIAICDLPSLGLGYEMGFAIEKLNKPTLIVAHKDAIVTRLIRGIEKENVAFERYSHMSEIPGFVRKFIEERGIY